LESTLDSVRAGVGRVVVIDGPAGIGKTRLLSAGRERAARQGISTFTARGSDLEREFAYGVVRQLFEQRVVRDGTALLSGVTSHVATVFGRLGDGRERPAGPSTAALEHALFWLVANLSEAAPLMIAVDDAQWADEASLRFLLYLARRVDELPVAVVLAGRPATSGLSAELMARIAAEPLTTELALHPLSAAAATRLVQLLVGPATSDELCDACYTSTGGNPFLLGELAGALADMTPYSSLPTLAGVERLVPRAVSRHVLIRLARLRSSATALASAVAILGADAEPLHAAALAGVDEATAADDIDALVAADILVPERPLSFAHPLLREVIYAELTPGRRNVEHRRAARLLADCGADPERTASQLLACGPFGADWAVKVLRMAARDAQVRGGSRSAVTYLERALAEPPAPGERPPVLLELGLAESSAALPAASQHLHQAFNLVTDPIARAPVAAELAVALEHAGQPVEAIAVLNDAIDSLGESGVALRMNLEAQAIVAANTFLDARRAFQDRIVRARAQLPALTSSYAGPLLAALAHEMAHRGGTAQQTAECAERSLACGLGTESLWDGVVTIVAAEALARCDRMTRALAILDALLSIARARGATHVETATLTARAVACNLAGRLLEAEADARLALDLAEGDSGDFLRPYQLAQLASALMERGQVEAAAQLLSPAELSRYASDQTIFKMILLDVHAELLTRQGHLQRALSELATVERQEHDWDIQNPGWTSRRRNAALIHSRFGDAQRATALADDELRLARAFGAPWALGIALRTAALIEDEPRVERLYEAADVLQGSEARLEYARTLVELGSALRRAGRRADAREPLTIGFEVARVCAATPLADQAYSELLASGVRPRRSGDPGPGVLTPSELRVATLAAEGLTNREIAQALYISLKTVEMHLSHAYDKLGVHSRIRLAAALPSSQSAGR
jgi:DNA-binding CsgD family transcriptional regulator